MGYRFSRRIKICKGLSLNVSKSGVGVSIGPRGAKLSIGPNGMYANFGIPGTGISSRQKIASYDSDYGNNVGYSNSSVNGYTGHISIDDKGNEIFYIKDSNGNIYNDPYLINKLKRDPNFKRSLEITRNAKNEEITKENEDFINIYKYTPELVTEQDIIDEMNNSDFQQVYYKVSEFSEPLPNKSELYEQASSMAEVNVKTLKFWKLKKLKSEYIQKYIEEQYQLKLVDWNKRKQEFDLEQSKIKEKKDAEYKADFEEKEIKRKEFLTQILNGDENYISATIKDVLSQIVLPIEFAVDYCVHGKTVELDIDLPEIEDIPHRKSSILQSGKLSVKEKTQTELFHDYATVVFGIAFYFTGIVFNISPAIENVKISGYTQRISKKTGNLEDEYVYQINFDRKEFATLNIQNIDPIEGVANFENTINITQKFELKTIDIPESINRKTLANKQEITESTVEQDNSFADSISYSPEEKSDSRLIDLTNETDNVSYINKEENDRLEAERKFQEQEEKTKKGCMGCLYAIIIAFVLLCIWVCTLPPGPKLRGGSYRSYNYSR